MILHMCVCVTVGWHVWLYDLTHVCVSLYVGSMILNMYVCRCRLACMAL